MTCPRCQTANPEGAKFCLNCGAGLDAPRPVEGERKFVTVLFADVVGSTAIGERLDPEQVIDVMNGAFALLNAAVARYGGTVARLMGDAILAFFGAPIAHEDDPERAVRAGLEIRAAASEYARAIERAYGVEFDVRVGINTGLAVLAAVGDTTNLASRLQNAADPGTVLISAETRRLVQGAFELKARGAIEVKGKSEPLEVYEVLAPRATPGNPRGVPGLHSPLVGRDAESRLLRERVAGLRGPAQERAWQGAFIAVIGEAGLGKSRLVAEVRETATAGDSPTRPAITWLEARTVSY